MENYSKKDEIQKSMVSFLNTHRKALFLISMGAGKTKGALDCVKSIEDQEFVMNAPKKGLIVCHDATARDTTWLKEIEQYHPWLLKNIKAGLVELVHRKDVLKIDPFKSYTWVIWDEAHLMKPEQIAFFQERTIPYVMLLTGTEPDDPEVSNVLRAIVNNKVMKVSVEEAIDDNVINDYRVKVINLKFNAEDEAKYMSISKSLTYAHRIGNRPMYAAMTQKRYNFIYECETKLKALKTFNQLLTGTRRLIFTTREEYAKQLGEGYYTGTSGDDGLLAFKENVIESLASIKMLKTGANLPNFGTILAQQVDSKSTNFMQNLARVFRMPVDQIGVMYLFVIHDTQDMIWQGKAVKHIPESKIRYYEMGNENDSVRALEIISDPIWST